VAALQSVVTDEKTGKGKPRRFEREVQRSEAWWGRDGEVKCEIWSEIRHQRRWREIQTRVEENADTVRPAGLTT